MPGEDGRVMSNDACGDTALSDVENRVLVGHVCKCLKNFVLRDCPLKDRLLLAMEDLDAELRGFQVCPEDLRQRAAQLTDELRKNEQWLKKGAGQPVKQLAETFAEQFLELAIDLAVAAGHEEAATPSG
jgi:hypothetical protein